MLLWKLLVVADIVLNASYWLAVAKRHEHLGPSDYWTIPIGLIGTAGLVIYAFSLPAISRIFWRYFVAVLAVSGASVIAKAINKDDINLGTVIGGLLALALLGFTCVAAFRLGGSQWMISS